MANVDELLKEARRLTRDDRRKLVDELEAELTKEAMATQPVPPEGSHARMLAAVDSVHANGPFAKTLAMAGVGHTDYTDVSCDKYKHLGEIYGDNHEDE